MSTTLIEPHRRKLLARALFAHLSPMTGTRASGTVAVSAPAGADVTLPRNSYLRAIVGGEADDNRIFKVGPNPDSLDHSWEVPGGGTLAAVPIVSNVGGADQNLPAGTRLRFEPRFPGLEQEVELEAAITNGTSLQGSIFGASAGQPALLRRMVFWQTMETAKSAIEFFAASAGAFPALLMVWTRSVPLQGRTSGGRQGNTRGGRGDRIFREGFELFIGSGNQLAADERRSEAMAALEAVERLLSDSSMNVDAELLSTLAGIEVTGSSLAVAAQNHYVYRVGIEVNQTLERVERRTFGPWDFNHIEITFPGREAPEPDEELTVVDVTDPMNP